MCSVIVISQKDVIKQEIFGMHIYFQSLKNYIERKKLMQLLVKNLDIAVLFIFLNVFQFSVSLIANINLDHNAPVSGAAGGIRIIQIQTFLICLRIKLYDSGLPQIPYYVLSCTS